LRLTPLPWLIKKNNRGSGLLTIAFVQ